MAGGRQAVKDFEQFAVELLDRYAEQPGPGMLSGMVNEDGAEGRMSKGVLASNALLLIFAGHETTVNLIAHSVLTLLQHPDALEKLRRRPELIVPGVEELLRFESSVQFWHTRSAQADIDIAGTTIPKGAPIFLAYGSANRDPERFANPDELDLERPDNQHLGFSQGIHFCFGAPLARLEVQVAVGEFFRRVENPRLVEDPGIDATLRTAAQVARVLGHLTIVGLGGGALPVDFSSPPHECSVAAPYWGSLPELMDVITLARQQKIKLLVEHFPLERADEAYRLLRTGGIQGRAVITPHG
ncbi:cytochrome P450 [Streptomyces sp. NPDC001848]|uniref:cytochrome P450 n=1 Tax=Streptomyces sp. NPDC001848 TaxID=3364618 RepID=UPI0036C8BD52